ncbi:membrane-spanning 4-domains subfamily A member 15-like [Hyla sarda]|uniref:membrane-spanning 4-domains subfamily A member 15-like n=1 Tax=Hyla sarda TaxID=327740 RepID=UPI0024C323E4|nr:membrane-spanning 4-domains subfamily A member 15-like [Hyla sarda]XP_056387716.1 membrane-spanning 4-domains subfamily A member 15-like [Hyla sarda]
MSLQMNEITTQDQEYAPPKYDEIIGIPMWNVNTVLPTEHPWNEYTQPPAYDTLPDTPIWTIPLPDPNRSLSAQQLNADSQVHLYCPVSSPQYRRTNAVLSQNYEMSLFRYRCWRSPPAIIGVWLLIAAFVQVGTGTVLAFSHFAKYSDSLTYGIPIWAPVCYLFTGGLSITAHFKPFFCHVRNLLCSNIITIIISSVGLVFNVKDLEELWDMMLNPSSSYISRDDFNIYYVLIGTNVVLLCFSVSAGIFGSAVLCRSLRKDPQESEIENDFIPQRPFSDLPETTFSSPPPYTPQIVYSSRITQ